MLGYFFNAEGFIKKLKTEAPHLIPKILVIDFNLQNHPKIKAHGVKVMYGDISNPETLRHFHIEQCKVVLSTIDDIFLRGTSNIKLLEELKILNPKVRFISTSSNTDIAEKITAMGAFACVCPPDEAAPQYIKCLKEALET